MTLLDIIQPDNPVLRRKARRVTSFDRRFQKLVDDMIETMREAKGIGLAAPQVAVSQRVFVARLPDDSEEAREEFGEQAGVLYVIANPKLARVSKGDGRRRWRAVFPSPVSSATWSARSRSPSGARTVTGRRCASAPKAGWRASSSTNSTI